MRATHHSIHGNSLTCENCGKPLHPRRASRRMRFCNDACRKSAARALKKVAGYPYSRASGSAQKSSTKSKVKNRRHFRTAPCDRARALRGPRLDSGRLARWRGLPGLPAWEGGISLDHAVDAARASGTRNRNSPGAGSGLVYGWFTEGFDTPVRQEAKVLLDGLVFTAYPSRPRRAASAAHSPFQAAIRRSASAST
jgi:hypothetical protein